MPTNNIRRKNGNKVHNKNAKGRRGIWSPHGNYILSPRARTHTDPVVRSAINDGHDNPARMRNAITKSRHHGENHETL